MNIKPLKTDEHSNLNLPGVTDVIVDNENSRGAHVTTRPHNRKVVFHKPNGTWFVFYGTGHWTEELGDKGRKKEMIVWRSSTNGITFSEFTPASIGNGHSSSCDVILEGNHIFLSNTRWNYWRDKGGIPTLIEGKPFYYHHERIDPNKPMYFVPYEVFPFDIVDRDLITGEPVVALPGDKHLGHAGPHYGSITRDTNGYLWVAARATMQVKPIGRLGTWVSRTTKPDDISSWEPYTVLFESAGPGTHAPQIIGLDEGRVSCVLFTKYEQQTAVYLYDPNSEEWAKPHIIGKGYMSKRASAVFDPNSRRLHIVYTDEAGDARHRALSAPYGIQDWSPSIDEPGNLVAEKAGTNTGDDDLSLSVNLSQNPGTLALVHRGPDLHLHLKYYDGEKWSLKDVKIGTQNPELTCDEASTVVEFSKGLGFVYWCKWKDPEVSKQKNLIGQMRFCLVKNVPLLFTNE